MPTAFEYVVIAALFATGGFAAKDCVSGELKNYKLDRPSSLLTLAFLNSSKCTYITPTLEIERPGEGHIHSLRCNDYSVQVEQKSDVMVVTPLYMKQFSHDVGLKQPMAPEIRTFTIKYDNRNLP